MGFNFLLIPLAAVELPPEPPPRELSRSERLEKARRIYNFRRKRELGLPADLFSEPAWDILLLAYIAMEERQHWPTTAVCAGSGAPHTTALRWVTVLEQKGLITRRPDPKDKRRAFVELTDEGRSAMDQVLDRAP